MDSANPPELAKGAGSVHRDAPAGRGVACGLIPFDARETVVGVCLWIALVKISTNGGDIVVRR
jgi:hypothetical protein